MNKIIPPTQPVLPPYETYVKEIASIWESKILTNDGAKSKTLRSELEKYIGGNAELFVNGHSALLIGLLALELQGEVITSPFTFISTTNAITQAGLTPIFCDIDDSYNVDPNKIESLITDRTSAIVVPHIFGIPCQVDRLRYIADKHNLKLIFDAAQAFGTKIGDKHVLLYGDMSMVSFHAIKVFNAIEGGMLVFNDATIRDKLCRYRNFGIDYAANDVSLCGYNAKMNEFQAAMGIVNLPGLEIEIAKRERLATVYVNLLRDVEGIITFNYQNNIRYNHAYFPVLVDSDKFGVSRDVLWQGLKERGVCTRKLYGRLTSEMSFYDKYKNADIPKARELSANSLDLPMYGTLTENDITYIVDAILDVKSTGA